MWTSNLSLAIYNLFLFFIIFENQVYYAKKIEESAKFKYVCYIPIWYLVQNRVEYLK